MESVGVPVLYLSGFVNDLTVRHCKRKLQQRALFKTTHYLLIVLF